jgi:hypothetical protein
VRSVNGRTAAWFRGTQVRHEGRIEAGGVAKDVKFVDADPIPKSTTSSMPRTGQSTGAMRPTSLTALLFRRHDPRHCK